jgi:cobalt-zinc-cadmium efflux system outer membrane protein
VLELRQHDQRAAEIALDLATRMRAAGNNTDLDLAVQRDQAEQARLEADAALLHLNEACERLNRRMGTWGAQTAWRMAARLPELPPKDPPMEGVEGRAIARSLHAAAAQQAVTVAAQRAGVARPFALLDDEAAIGVSAERDASDHEWGLGPAVRMPVPIFNTGQTATLAAQAELRRTEDAFYAIAVEIRTAVRLARHRLELARVRSAYMDHEVVPLRERIVAQTLLQYNAMAASPFQLIAARRLQIEAAIASVAALAGYWDARVRVDQLLAGGYPDPDDPVPVIP